MTDATRPRPDAGAARTYLLTGSAAQLVLLVALVQAGGPVAAVPSLLAALGLVLRWSATPALFAVLMGYFLVYPTGIPVTPGKPLIASSYLRVTDLVLAAAVVVYFASHYRRLSAAGSAVPPDLSGRTRKGGDKRTGPAVTTGPATDADLARMLAGAVVAAVAGQAVWYVLTHTTVDLADFPPLRWGGADPPSQSGLASRGAQHAVLLAGLLMVVGAVVWFAFWYWRLTRLTPVEAYLAVVDVGWRESRRELNRLAKWQAWATGRTNRPADPGVRPPGGWAVWVVGGLVAGGLVGLAVAGLMLAGVIRVGD